MRGQRSICDGRNTLWKPRSGVMGNKLEELLAHYILHWLCIHGYQFELHYRSMWKYTKQISMAMNRQIQMWLHAKGCHSHEQGPVKPVSKSIWRYMYTMEYNMISHDHWSHIGTGSMKMSPWYICRRLGGIITTNGIKLT